MAVTGELSFKELLGATDKSKNASMIRKAKEQGRKIVGVLSEQVPEEVIHAAGMMPWKVEGTRSSSLVSALVYRRADSCLYCNHVLESVLNGELDFLDGIVATNADQDLVRLWDVWNYLGKTSFSHIIHVPRNDSEACCRFFGNEIARFAAAVEAFGHTTIAQHRLLASVKAYNHTRDLLAQLYSLRKSVKPAVTGSQVARITAAARLMPREEYNDLLQEAIGWLEKAENPERMAPVRLLLSSDMLDELGYMELVEATGCLVAMDDLDSGARYSWGRVVEDSTDPVNCLARRYLGLPTSPRMFSWDRQVSQIIEWAREYRVHGVLEMVQLYSRAREMRTPFLAKRLQEVGIPFMSVSREYHLSNVGQMKTRVGAFVEMLQQPQA